MILKQRKFLLAGFQEVLQKVWCFNSWHCMFCDALFVVSAQLINGFYLPLKSDELKDFFSKYGNVEEHQIIREHATNRSRGFGFVVFESEKVVDNLLANGNKIDMEGTQVSYWQWSLMVLGVDKYVNILYEGTLKGFTLKCSPNCKNACISFHDNFTLLLHSIFHVST